MEKITYADKEALNEIPSIADKNKCKASDLNQIKNVVNANADAVGDIVIVPTETPTEETKLEIEDEDFDFKGSEITDEYSESTEVGYSANYSNGHFQGKGQVLWTNPNPTSAITTLTINLNNNNYDLLLVLFSQEAGTDLLYSAWTTKGQSFRIIGASSQGTLIRNLIRTNDTEYVLSDIQGSAGNKANTNLIPYQIIGYKF